jgi:hemolysin activation/secretion protein
MKKIAEFCLNAVALQVALACASVNAQTDAGAILQQQNRQDLRQIDRIPEASKPNTPEKAPPLSGPRVQVKGFKFAGNEGLISISELQTITSRWVGQEVDFATLDRITRQITEILRTKNWFLAQAYLPQQDVTSGDITIAILPGYLDGGNGKGSAYSIASDSQKPVRLSSRLIESIANRQLQPGAIANEANLERTLLLIGEVPGLTARSQLEPGVNAGATRILINIEEGPIFGGAVMADNYGSRFTGTNQMNASLQFNDPSGAGEQFTLNATHTDGLNLMRFGYSIPVAADGLRIAASWSPMNYKIVQGLGVTAGLKGSSNTAAVSATYPFKRSRVENIYGNLVVSQKSLEDDSNSGLLKSKVSQSFNANVSGDQLDGWGGGGLLSGNLGITSGYLDLSRLPADSAADATGYATQGNYHKLTFGVNRLQKITSSLNLMVNFYGQVAAKNLDSSEKFGLGGPTGIRAYTGGEGMGDSGWVSNLELRYDVQELSSEKVGQLQLIAFYDAGRVRLHKDVGSVPIPTLSGLNSYGLSGWGLGANLNKSASHAVRLVWAQKSGTNLGASKEGMDADGKSSASRVWIQGTWLH